MISERAADSRLGVSPALPGGGGGEEASGGGAAVMSRGGGGGGSGGRGGCRSPRALLAAGAARHSMSLGLSLVDSCAASSVELSSFTPYSSRYTGAEPEAEPAEGEGAGLEAKRCETLPGARNDARASARKAAASGDRSSSSRAAAPAAAQQQRRQERWADETAVTTMPRRRAMHWRAGPGSARRSLGSAAALLLPDC